MRGERLEVGAKRLKIALRAEDRAKALKNLDKRNMQQTNNLHTILTYACEEAGRLGNAEIMPDHMLLGILRLGAGKAFELLMQAGIDPVACKRQIDERLRQAETTQTQKR